MAMFCTAPSPSCTPQGPRNWLCSVHPTVGQASACSGLQPASSPTPARPKLAMFCTVPPQPQGSPNWLCSALVGHASACSGLQPAAPTTPAHIHTKQTHRKIGYVLHRPGSTNWLCSHHPASQSRHFLHHLPRPNLPQLQQNTKQSPKLAMFCAPPARLPALL